MDLSERRATLCAENKTDFSDRRAVFVNCTLKHPDQASHTTIMSWNLLHMERMLKDSGGLPNHGNDRKAWTAGCRFDFENPEHRS